MAPSGFHNLIFYAAIIMGTDTSRSPIIRKPNNRYPALLWGTFADGAGAGRPSGMTR